MRPGAGGETPDAPAGTERDAPALLVAGRDGRLAETGAPAAAEVGAPAAADGTGRHAPVLVVSGGVAANARLRAALAEAAAAEGFTLAAPPLRLCTDNAVMVAWAGQERLRLGLTADGLGHAPRPRWPLESLGESEGTR
ncbi:MAG: hypothetical protein IT557_00990 [Alphaproteobacteria bacterium]|nr:hypothetical protein [Alphaproteobacteria bacterium]